MGEKINQSPNATIKILRVEKPSKIDQGLFDRRFYLQGVEGRNIFKPLFWIQKVIRTSPLRRITQLNKKSLNKIGIDRFPQQNAQSASFPLLPQTQLDDHLSKNQRSINFSFYVNAPEQIV